MAVKEVAAVQTRPPHGTTPPRSQPPVAVVAQLVAEAAAEAEAAAVPVEHQGDWTLEPLLLGERSIAGLQRRQCSC